MGFSSPEQLLGETVTEAADVYSLGVLAHHLLTGEGPYDVRSTAQLVQAHVNLIRIYAVLSAAFIPDASKTMIDAMQTDDDSWPTDVAAALETLPAGHAFTVPDNLFRKITDEERAEWAERFAGKRD